MTDTSSNQVYSSRSISILPDILNNVLNICYDEIIIERRAREFYSYILVNKTWYLCAIHYLWNTIYISWENADALEKSIWYAKHIVTSHTQGIAFMCTINWSSCTIPAQLLTLLSLCPNIQKMSFTFCDLTDIQGISLFRFPKLRSLFIEGCKKVNEKLIQDCHNLEVLSLLSRDRTKEMLILLSISTCSNLRKLKLNCWRSNAAIEKITQCPILEELGCLNLRKEHDLSVISQVMNLRKLSLSYWCRSNIKITEFPMCNKLISLSINICGEINMASIAENCPALSTLHIFYCSEIINFVDVIRINKLTSLQVKSTPISTEVLDAILCLHRLKNLELVDDYGRNLASFKETTVKNALSSS